MITMYSFGPIPSQDLHLANLQEGSLIHNEQHLLGEAFLAMVATDGSELQQNFLSWWIQKEWQAPYLSTQWTRCTFSKYIKEQPNVSHLPHKRHGSKQACSSYHFSLIMNATSSLAIASLYTFSRSPPKLSIMCPLNNDRLTSLYPYACGKTY